MFNIRNLVNRISQVKDGEAGENSSSNRSRSQSQISGTSVDGAVPVEAEGFLCPSCMAAFSSPDDLQNHYQADHLDPGANYLCPVCKARLVTAEELELHFSANHLAPSSLSVKSEDVEKLVKQIGELTSSLSEEKWHSQELCKELENLREMLEAQGTSDEQKMYQHQLQGLQETKSLLTSEVVFLRKQLTESLASLVQVKQDKEKIEAKAAGYSQLVAELQANLDDNNSHIAGLKENIKDLQLQLGQLSTNEDAEAQIKELSLAQKLAEELIASKDKKLADLQREVEELQLRNGTQQDITSMKEATLKNSLEERISELEGKNQSLESEVKQHLTEIEKLGQLLSEKGEQLQSLQHIREETDVCVGHLREEVTALQDMLNEARHQAEGQVSAKDDELFKFKQDFLKQEKQVMHLEEQCQGLKRTNENLTKDLAQQGQLIEDREQAFGRKKEEINQLGEKVSRLESEKMELLNTIQKGEGMIDTAIQQLKKENERLQEELSRMRTTLTSVEQQAKTNSAEWSRTEQQLREEQQQLEEKFKNSNTELQKSLEIVSSLKEAIRSKDNDLKNWQAKFDHSEKDKVELESLSQRQSKQLEKSSQEKTVIQKEFENEKDKNAALSKASEALQTSVEESEKQIGELRIKCQHLSKVTQDLDRARKELEESQGKTANLNGIKEKLEEQLKQSLEHLESLEKTRQDRDGEISTLNLILQESQSRIGDLENSVIEKDRALCQQKARITELEPLTEALEQEKMKRIKEKGEWNEHEQLLRGEKEALSTSMSHLQQQLSELTKEHRFHLQRVKTEGETLLKEKNTLSEQLNTERERRAKDLEEWQGKQSKLEEEAKTLVMKLKTVEDLSATRYQRCEELQATSEKYLSLKIELEAKVSMLEEEKLELQNNCNQWETEVDRLKFNTVELRRRLEDSQAALHELGRENQSLQMENAKLMGRKWADDSEVNDCHNCHKGFNLTVRKHHCRNCGQIFCNECSGKSAAVGNSRKPVRVCDPCFKELNINPTR